MNKFAASCVFVSFAALGAAVYLFIKSRAVTPLYVGTWDDINSATLASSTSGPSTGTNLTLHMRGYLDGTSPTTPGTLIFSSANYPDTYKIQGAITSGSTQQLWDLLTKQKLLVKDIQPSTNPPSNTGADFYYAIGKIPASEQKDWTVDAGCDTATVSNNTIRQAYVDVIFKQTLVKPNRDELAALIEWAQQPASPMPGNITVTDFDEIKNKGARAILRLP